MQDSHRQITYLSIGYLAFLIALTLILGYTPTNDSEGYREFADVCIQQGEPYPCLALIKGQPFIWNIGIINLIAASMALFHSYFPVLLLMCAMKAATAWLVGRIAEVLTDSKTALIATIVFVCYPNNWGDCTMLMSEVPMVFFALWGIYLILSRNRARYWLLGGLLLAVANWFRPIAILFILSLFAYFLLFNRKRLLQRIGFVTIGACLFVTIVGTECKVRTGHFVYQAESFWFNMADECYDGSPVKPHYGMDMYAKGTPRYIEHREQLTCFECSDIWKERSLAWLKAHPTEYLSKIPGRLVYMYMSDFDNLTIFLPDRRVSEDNFITLPYRHLLSEFGTLGLAQQMALLDSIFYYALLLLAVAAVIIMSRLRQYQSLFLPLFIVVFGSLSLVLAVHGETRFKTPFMPFVMILASVAISKLSLKRHG